MRRLLLPTELCIRIWALEKTPYLDVLHLPSFYIYGFLTNVVMLVLILRLYLLGNAVEFFIAFLSVQLLLVLLIHFLTSDIVCEQWNVLCIEKAPRRVPVYYSLFAIFSINIRIKKLTKTSIKVIMPQEINKNISLIPNLFITMTITKIKIYNNNFILV